MTSYHLQRWLPFFTEATSSCAQRRPFDTKAAGAAALEAETIWQVATNATQSFPRTTTGDTLVVAKSLWNTYYADQTANGTYEARPNLAAPETARLQENPTWSRHGGLMAFLCNTAGSVCGGFDTQGYLLSNTTALVPTPGVTTFVKTAV